MTTTEIEPVSTSADVRDELAALKQAAIARVSSSAWAAKQACEEISKDGACNAKTEIERARKNLADAEKHFNALVDYEAKYRVVMKDEQ